MTLWHPDTCGCEIEISDEAATLGEVIRHIKVCSVHANLAQDHHSVLAENQRKNRVLKDIKEALPNADVRWTMAQDRAVEISFGPDNAPSSGQKQGLAAQLTARYGQDKIRVV